MEGVATLFYALTLLSLTIRAAGGFIIQLLPTAQDDTIDLVEECIDGIPSVTQMLTSGMTPEDICRKVLLKFELERLDGADVEYKCSCSRERVEKALISVGKQELEEMAKDNGTEVCCHFCDKKYRFTAQDIMKLARNSAE